MEESSQKGRFIKPLQSMLNSDSPSVAFESATTLVTLSSAPSAVKAAANTLLSLLSSQTDNNVKIVILDRLSVIIRHNCRLLEDSVMELLALLRTPSTKIRSSLLELGALLVSDRSIAEVMNFLKSEVVRTASDSDELGREYRELLIQSIHALAVRFPAVADTVILLLLDYLNSDSGVSILSLVKEMLLHQSALVDSVLAKLFEVFSSLEKEDVILSALWIIAEFTPIASLPQAIQTILVLLPSLLSFLGRSRSASSPPGRRSHSRGVGCARFGSHCATRRNLREPELRRDRRSCRDLRAAAASPAGGAFILRMLGAEQRAGQAVHPSRAKRRGWKAAGSRSEAAELAGDDGAARGVRELDGRAGSRAD